MKSLCFLFSLLIFFSCNSSTSIDTDIDAIDNTDTFAETEETDNVDENDEYDDDSDHVGTTQIRFLSSPHGITRWNEQYSYFIRCESDKDFKTSTSVSQQDTCKGEINIDTYMFIPTKELFPEGKCTIAVECTDGTKKTVQKTEILIPNPVDMDIADEQIMEFDVLWSDGKTAIVKDDNERLYGINETTETVSILNDSILTNSSMAIMENGIYFIATENESSELKIYFSNGKKDEIKTVLDQDDFSSENSEQIEFKYIYSPPGLSGVIIHLKNGDSSEIWHFNPESNLLSEITSLDIFEFFGLITCVDSKCLAGSKDWKYVTFDEKTLSTHPFCDNIKWNLFNDMVWNNKIFKNNCPLSADDKETCLEYYDVDNCERTVLDKDHDEIVSTEIYLSEDLYTVVKYQNSLNLTQFTKDGTQRNMDFSGKMTVILNLKSGLLFKIENDMEDKRYLVSKTLWPPIEIEKCKIAYNCKNNHLFCINQFDNENFSEEKSCYSFYDLETGKETQSKLKCRASDSFEIIGEFNDSVYVTRNGIKYNPENFKTDYNGNFSKSLISLNFTPEDISFMNLHSTDNSDSMYFHSYNSVDVLGPSDSSRYQNITRLNSKYKPLNINIKENTVLLKTSEVLVSYNYKTDKSELIKTDTFTGNIYFSGNLTLFSVKDKDIENTQIFYTTDGTKSGTVEHGRKYWGFRAIPSEDGGFYVKNGIHLYHIDKTGKNSTILLTGKVDYLGVTKEGTVFNYTDPLSNTEKVLSFNSGTKISEHSFSSDEENHFIFVEKDYIRIMINSEKGLKIMHFADGDLSSEPLEKIIINDKIQTISRINGKNEIAAYFLERKYRSPLIVFIKVQDNMIKTPLEPVVINEYNIYKPINGLFSSDRFIYQNDANLYSIYLSENFGMIQKTLFDGKDFTNNESGYLGKIITLGSDFEGNAIFQYNHPDKNDKLIFSDGTMNSTILTDISYWDQVDIINGKVLVKGSVLEVISDEIVKNDFFSKEITSVKFTDNSRCIFTESDNGNIIFKEYFVPTPLQSQIPSP